MYPAKYTKQLYLCAIGMFPKAILVLVSVLLFSIAGLTQNPVSIENALPGNPAAEWDIAGAGDLSIQGFSTDISINTGGTIHFKIDVKAPATNYSIKIYRLGYYGGNGARLVSDLGNAFVGVAQPAPLFDAVTGKTDCSNWSHTNESWTATGAVSGIYIARITRNDNNGASHIAFIVRNDGGNSALLFKTSDATWQAYNGYGGNSFYVGGAAGPPALNHASKISYNRPFYTRAGGGGSGSSEDWLFNAEYPMVRWLERNGYDVSYTTDVDMDRNVVPITTSIHKILLSVGHDEYWSKAERTNFETARNNGVHLAFFSGNEVYWKTRWEDNNRTLVCYKEGTLGENVCGSKCDPEPAIWTGLWRDGCAYPAADGCNPENALTGQISWQGTNEAILVPDTYKNLRFWRNTSIATLGTGQTATLADNTLGYEWDWEQYTASYPSGRILLSSTTASGRTHKLSLYKHSSGAWVFGAGTVQWSWGLDGVHDRGASTEDVRMQQATVNLFADMTVQPVTLQGNLTAASASTDNTAPVSVITYPANAATVSSGIALTISGTAADANAVGGVEVSVDGGATWHTANGTSGWTYTWTPPAAGTYTIKCRSFDDSGNMEAAGTAPAPNAVTITVTTLAPPEEGPGGPILVISKSTHPFSRYPVEILRAEGLNEFAAMDIAAVTPAIINTYDVVILGEIPVSGANVTMLTDWVNAGGTLIAFKPDAQLASLLGISPAAGSLADKYLLFNTAGGPGAGLVNQTIQFHGTADYYTLNGAAALATLYSTASTPTSYPAITTKTVGANGGKAIAFTYDLARSVVYTRQGNPLWAGQNRDGQSGPIRSDNLYFGNKPGDPQPDYIDFDKVAIPQADEQQRLLTNIIIQGNLHRKPLPRFWFLPRKLKAAVVMTGDDHANGATVGRFNQYLTMGPNTAQDVLNWDAIRGTSYIYTSTNNTTTITNAQAAAFEAQGFEIAAHISTNCGDWTSQTQLDNSFFTPQLAEFAGKWPGVPAPSTNRTHCIAWSDWASQPKVQASKGIRLDCNYYYWPGSWIQNRPGMFTGSGMPMRFADMDGSLIDCYQVTTQMPDESGITWPGFINTLLDNAIGSTGYYGVFCANMHTDNNNPGDQSVVGSNAIIAAAQARQIPVISARQMLTWLDGRNSSSFSNIAWNANTLSFTVNTVSAAYKLQGMVPVSSAAGQLTGITRNAVPVSYTTEIIKGINYAFFDAGQGNYAATYLVDNTGPVITNITATPGSGTALITWTTDEASDSRVDYGTSAGSLNLNESNATLVTSHSIAVTGLTAGVTYYYRVTSADALANSTTEPVPPATLNFTIPLPPCFQDQLEADFNGGAQSNTYITNNPDGEVILKPTAAAEFTVLPPTAAWKSFDWGSGGTSTVSAGVLSVNGARFNSDIGTPFSAGATMEFKAIFGTASFQHIGFGGGNDAVSTNGIYTGQNPWAMFSTGNQNTVLRVRTSLDGSNSTDIDLSSSLIGTAHVYKIIWKTASVEYYVDGVLVYTANATIPGTMRPAISDYTVAAPGIAVDWIHVTPFAASGTFTSRIYDAGVPKNWGIASWTATVPGGTTLQIFQRQANSAAAIPAAAWTAIAVNGANIGGTAQYIQYKAELTTSNTDITPVLNDISFWCSAASNTIPVVTTQPLSQAKCAGQSVTFSSNAGGNPAPTVQWQLSTDNGNTWADIGSATNPSLVFTTALPDNGNQYRAIWTNIVGSATSDAATLTVNPLPTGTINAVTNPVCNGGNVSLKLATATGASPYTLVVNGTTYNNVTVGQTFASFNPAELSIWGNTGSPVNPDANDSQPGGIETGTKFRSTLGGYITGIRFYKGTSNTGTHTAHLWTLGGTLLATAVFTAETASGWQEVRFSSPVAIAANTTYIASYLSPVGGFAITAGGLIAGVSNGPLTALAAGVDGVNGVYKYGGGFPDGGNNANYWVDVLFSEMNTASAVYDLTSITGNNGCANTGSPLSTVTVTFSAAPTGTIAATPATVCEGSTVNLTYTATTGTGPFSLLVNGTTYTNITSGTPFAAGIAAYTAPAPNTIWSAGTTGDSQGTDNTANIELGLRFKSAITGSISAIRFYKTTATVSTFTVNLWALGNTSTPLATATYNSDNTTGWKQVNFSSPVTITANTSYIASYASAAPNYYAYTPGGMSAPIVNAPLTAEASSYKVPGPGYPNTASTANYWVDVVFTGNSSTSSFNLTSITSAAGCITSGSPISSTVVNVNQSPVVNAGTYGPVCMDAPDITLAGTPAGGTFTGTGVSGNLFDPSVGTQTITYTYTNGAGCTNTASATITVLATGTWLGINNNWSDPQNWCGGVPVSSANVTIPSTVSNKPVLTANVSVGSINIDAAATITLNGNTLTINGTINGTGKLTGSAESNLVLNGTSNTLIFDQTSASTRSLNNLTLNTGASAILGNTLDVYGAITLTAATLDLASKAVTLKSNISSTARIGDLTGSTLSNATNVTVERFVGAAIPKSSWRLLTAPLRSTTAGNGLIFDYWQNGGNNVAGLGTQVTGPGGASATTGIDAWTVRPSVQYFDHTADQNLHPVTDTKTPGTATPLFTTAASAANKSYFIFVRGDRFVNPGDAANNTTFTPTGTLQTGDQTFATAATNPNDNTIVGNPYASPVDLNLFRLGNTASNVKTSYYYWDPYLTGNYGFGGYVTVSYDAVGTENISPSGANHTRFLQSGQAMFLERTASGAGTASVTFKENQKGSTNVGIFLTSGVQPDSIAVNLHVLTANTPILVDGTLATFDNSYAAGVDDYDATKFANTGESISFKRNGTALAIERRPLPGTHDTLFLNMRSMKAGNSYRFEFVPGFTTPTFTAFLQDSYVPGSNYPLSVTSGSSFDFTVTADAATAAANRFRIVFAGAGPLAVSFKTVKAYEQNRNINVEWKVENEIDMKQYEVEKSTDGSNFIKMNTTAALNQTSAIYTWTDVNPVTGYNFYRIRSIAFGGEIKYSSIVKVLIGKGASGIVIYPNPVQNGTVNLQMNNMPGGTYSMRLINTLGQVVQTMQLKHAAGSSTETLPLGSQLAKGNYNLEIIKPDNSRMSIKLQY